MAEETLKQETKESKMKEQKSDEKKSEETRKPEVAEQETKPKEASPSKKVLGDHNNTNKSDEKKSAPKKEKPEVVKGPKKTEGVVNGRDIPVSRKVAIALCNFIKKKKIDKAIEELEKVTRLKRAVPMKGEIAHRKGNMMSGKYPVKASGEFGRLLKSLKANAVYHELELEKVKIACKANKAPRPYRRFGRHQFKRCHVEIKLIPRVKHK